MSKVVLKHSNLLSSKSSIIPIVILGFMVLFCSCEGYRCAEGTIYDFDTKEPIDSVKCTVISGREIKFSDSLGRYSVCNSFGGCVPDCSAIIVEFSKEGYITKALKNPKYKSDIFLKKE